MSAGARVRFVELDDSTALCDIQTVRGGGRRAGGLCGRQRHGPERLCGGPAPCAAGGALQPLLCSAAAARLKVARAGQLEQGRRRPPEQCLTDSDGRHVTGTAALSEPPPVITWSGHSAARSCSQLCSDTVHTHTVHTHTQTRLRAPLTEPLDRVLPESSCGNLS